MSKKPLHIRYRPGTWDEVVGQKSAVTSISKAITSGDAQAFILSGPSGVGKTTIARIAAQAFGCDEHSLLETNAAVTTGIDGMRKVIEAIQYVSLGASTKRAVLIDEAHGLSKQAWDSILKATEEPPEHVVWFFCTTNAAKIPKTMKTRCLSVELKLIPDQILGELFDEFCEKEGIDLPGDVGDLIIREAHGSARQMISNLVACRDAKNKKVAAALLKTALETDATIELCRFLAARRSGSWQAVMALVNRLEGENPEGVRIVIMNYMGSALKNSKSDDDAVHFLSRLEPFAAPYHPAEGIAPLLRSIGAAIFSE